MALMTLGRRVVCKILQVLHSKLSLFFPKKGDVLMFHNFEDKEGLEFNYNPSDFEQLLVKLQHRNVIHLGDWKSQKKFVALTIDDVPESFYSNAFPLLVKYKLPFTIFVNVGLLDTPGFISSNQLKEMATNSLCTVGSHGMHHSFYKDFSSKDKETELRVSKMKLEQVIGKNVDLFAYPYGSYYACGFSAKHLVSKYYKYGFGTVSSSITTPILFPKYYLPRKNY